MTQKELIDAINVKAREIGDLIEQVKPTDEIQVFAFISAMHPNEKGQPEVKSAKLVRARNFFILNEMEEHLDDLL